MRIKLPIDLPFLLSLLFGGLLIYFAFFQPYEPDAIYTAVPFYATTGCREASWETLRKSPVWTLMESSIETDKPLNDLISDPSFSKWIERMIPADLFVAPLPQRQENGSKSWMLSSWVGWRSTWLRWRLEGTKAPYLDRIGTHAVWPVWVYEHPELGDEKLFFALTDKLFLACLSANPTDITNLINAYDGRIPAIQVRGK
jgi:hypothetical protein